MARNTIATDAFAASIDGSWNNGDGDWSPMSWISSGVIRPSVTGNDTAIARNTGTYPRAQWSKFVYGTFTSVSATVAGGPGVLMATGLDESGYFGVIRAGSGAKYEIFETDSGFGFGTLASTGSAPISFIAGDFAVLEMTDTSGHLNLYTSESGGAETSRLTATDTTITSGRPGGTLYADAVTAANINVSAWSGGDFASGVTVALSNAAATFSAGTLTPTATIPVANAAATFSAGTPIPTPTVALTNAAITSSAGTIAPSSSIPLTNALGTFSAGTITVTGDLTLALSGALGTFSASSVTPSSTLSLTAALGTLSAGTVAPVSTVALANSAGTFSATSLTPSSSVSLANVLATWTAGDVGIQGDVTIALTGASFTAQAGTLSVAASGETFSGGYFPNVKRRTPDDIRRARIEFGVLPPDEELKAAEAVELIVEAEVALSKAEPETQAATDALEAQQRAEQRFIAVYSRVYPALQKAQILESLRQEAEYKAAMMEEEAFVISLLF